MTKVINLFSGPGAGKSTLAAGLFHQMKMDGYNVELVTEYAKDKVWDCHKAAFDNQIYLFAKQHNRQFRLIDKVDYIITDSPLLLSLHYGIFNCDKQAKAFKKFVRCTWDTFDNINFFIRRMKPYTEVGRNQTLDEAKEIDASVYGILNDSGIDYIGIPGDRTGVQEMYNYIKVYGEK